MIGYIVLTLVGAFVARLTYDAGVLAGKDYLYKKKQEAFDEGYELGLDIGKKEAFEQGRKVGKEEGFEDGKRYGAAVSYNVEALKEMGVPFQEFKPIENK